MDFKQKEKKDFKLVCSQCSKPHVRKGSITGWIFKDSYCTCSIAQQKPPQLVIADEVSQATPSGSSGAKSPTPPMPSDLLLSSEEVPFEILELLGSGGMGSVYKVRDAELNQIFALKILHPALAEDEAAVRRFHQEAKAATELTHPNLVAVYRDGRSKSGAPYLVMDYVDGRDLSVVLQEEIHINAWRAISMFMHIADAIEHAHTKGVIHRDLKPSNIILMESDNTPDFVKIVDFGIAKVMATSALQTTNNLTHTGEVLGSPTYMSPEQCQGDKLDERSDIYSLGCVMYEVLTGRPPFRGSNPIKIILQHLNDVPATFSDSTSNTDELSLIERVIFRCLAKDRRMRYQSMRELKDDLQRLLDGKPLLAPELARFSNKTQSSSEQSFAENVTTGSGVHPSLRTPYLVFTCTFFFSLIAMTIGILLWERTLQIFILIFPFTGCVSLTWSYYVRRVSWLIQQHDSEVIADVIVFPKDRVKRYKVQVNPEGNGQPQLGLLIDEKLPTNMTAFANGVVRKVKAFKDPNTNRIFAIELGHQPMFIEPERFTISEPLQLLVRRFGAAGIDSLVVATFGLLIGALQYLLVFVLDGNQEASLGVLGFAPLLGLFSSILTWPAFAPLVVFSPDLVILLRKEFLMPIVSQLVVTGIGIGIVNWLYYSLMEASRFKGTIGKLLMGLSVTTCDGKQLTFLQATGRHFTKFVVGTLLFVIALTLVGWGSGGNISASDLTKAIVLQLIFAGLSIPFTRDSKLVQDLQAFTVHQKSKISKMQIGTASLMIALALCLPMFLGAQKEFFSTCIQTNLSATVTMNYEEKFSKEPTNSRLFLLRGRDYLDIGDHGKALQDFDQAIKLDPNDAYALISRAQANIEVGDIKGAERDLKLAKALEPNSSALRWMRSLLCLYEGKRALTEVPLENAHALSPSDQENELDSQFFGVSAAVMDGLADRYIGEDTGAKERIQKRAKQKYYSQGTEAMIQYLDGQLDAKQLLRDADGAEAHFLLGMDLAFKQINNKQNWSGEEARQHLNWVLDHGLKNLDRRGRSANSPYPNLTPEAMRQLAELQLKRLDEYDRKGG